MEPSGSEELEASRFTVRGAVPADEDAVKTATGGLLNKLHPTTRAKLAVSRTMPDPVLTHVITLILLDNSTFTFYNQATELQMESLV